MSRRQSSDPLERYDSRPWMIRALTYRVDLPTRIFEPCAGRGVIVDVLREGDSKRVIFARDIEPRRADISAGDTLANRRHWPNSEPCSIVTNPPFSRGADLYRLARAGRVPFLAMLLRLNWLERVEDRRLGVDMPDRMIVLPRIGGHAFVGKGSDSITVAWMIWYFDQKPLVGIESLDRVLCRSFIRKGE